jgi:hypothetical protein
MSYGSLPERLESILLDERTDNAGAHNPIRHPHQRHDISGQTATRFSFPSQSSNLFFSPHITIVHKEEEGKRLVRISDGMRERNPNAKRRFYILAFTWRFSFSHRHLPKHMAGMGYCMLFLRQSFCILAVWAKDSLILREEEKE